MASIEPQFVARMLLTVSQVKLQVIAVLVLPVTRPLKSCVLLVITLAEVGEIVMLTVDELLPPQPNAPRVATRVSNVESFHRFIPVLQKFRDIRTGSANTFTLRLPGPSIPELITQISAQQNSLLERPAHREPECAHWIKEICPLRIVKQIYDLRRDLGIPYIRR